jgi:hypothetical protein
MIRAPARRPCRRRARPLSAAAADRASAIDMPTSSAMGGDLRAAGRARRALGASPDRTPTDVGAATIESRLSAGGSFSRARPDGLGSCRAGDCTTARRVPARDARAAAREAGATVAVRRPVCPKDARPMRRLAAATAVGRGDVDDGGAAGASLPAGSSRAAILDRTGGAAAGAGRAETGSDAGPFAVGRRVGTAAAADAGVGGSGAATGAAGAAAGGAEGAGAGAGAEAGGTAAGGVGGTGCTGTGAGDGAAGGGAAGASARAGRKASGSR